jgi:thiamine biosynthesis lipoprotein
MKVRDIVAALVLAAAAGGCARRDQPVEQTWMTMGTFGSITVPARDRDRLAAYAAAARDTTSNLEARLSIFVPDSEISKLNAAAGQAPIPISEDTRRALELTLYYGRWTEGCFDATVGPLMKLWGFRGGPVPFSPPKAAEIAAALSRVGFNHLWIYRDSPDTAPDAEMGGGKGGGHSFVNVAGASVDLGGIAKGYAADRCFERLLAMGASNLMVNLGGNIRCIGSPASPTKRQPDPRTAWRIGIRNPFEREQIVGTVSLSNGMAVATSGNYERFVMIGGQRYAHIMDPRTGYPVKGMAGVTVVSSRAVEADALSTALFVLGRREATLMLMQFTNSCALFIPDQQPIRAWITPGFARFFTPEPPLCPTNIFLLVAPPSTNAVVPPPTSTTNGPAADKRK